MISLPIDFTNDNDIKSWCIQRPVYPAFWYIDWNVLLVFSLFLSLSLSLSLLTNINFQILNKSTLLFLNYLAFNHRIFSHLLFLLALPTTPKLLTFWMHWTSTPHYLSDPPLPRSCVSNIQQYASVFMFTIQQFWRTLRSGYYPTANIIRFFLRWREDGAGSPTILHTYCILG